MHLIATTEQSKYKHIDEIERIIGQRVDLNDKFSKFGKTEWIYYKNL